MKFTRLVLTASLLCVAAAASGAAARAPFKSFEDFYKSMPGKPVFTAKPAGFSPYMDERNVRDEYVFEEDSVPVTFAQDGDGISVNGRFYSLRNAVEFPGGPDPDLFLYGAQVYTDDSNRICIQANFAGLGDGGVFQFVNSIILLDQTHSYILSGLEASCTAFKKTRNGTLLFPRINLVYDENEVEDGAKRYKIEQLQLRKGSIKRKSTTRLRLAEAL